MFDAILGNQYSVFYDRYVSHQFYYQSLPRPAANTSDWSDLDKSSSPDVGSIIMNDCQVKLGI